MKQRTSSPISDPEPNYDIPEPTKIVDPIEDETVSFRADKKYGKVLEKLDARKDALRREVATKPDGMSYEEFGMKTEIANRVITELDNFIQDVELTYGLRKQQEQGK